MQGIEGQNDSAIAAPEPSFRVKCDCGCISFKTSKEVEEVWIVRDTGRIAFLHLGGYEDYSGNPFICLKCDRPYNPEEFLY